METLESQFNEFIASLAIHAKIGRWGSLESPFYEISERSKGARMLYLSPGKDEYYMVAAGNPLALNQGLQEEQVVPVRYRQEFKVESDRILGIRLPTRAEPFRFITAGHYWALLPQFTIRLHYERRIISYRTSCIRYLK